MFKHVIRRVLPLLTTGALLATAQSFASTPHFVMTPDGNVGVGVDAPSEKLQVQGKIRASDIIELEWNGATLRWRWSPSSMSGGPTVTVTATDLATDYPSTFY